MMESFHSACYGAMAILSNMVGAYETSNQWKKMKLEYLITIATSRSDTALDETRSTLRNLSRQLDACTAHMLVASQDVSNMENVRVCERRIVAERLGIDFEYTAVDTATWMCTPAEEERMKELQSLVGIVHDLRVRVRAYQGLTARLQEKRDDFMSMLLDYQLARDTESVTRHLSKAYCIDLDAFVDEITKDLDTAKDRLEDIKPDPALRKQLNEAFTQLHDSNAVRDHVMRSDTKTKSIVDVIMHGPGATTERRIAKQKERADQALRDASAQGPQKCSIPDEAQPFIA